MWQLLKMAANSSGDGNESWRVADNVTCPDDVTVGERVDLRSVEFILPICILICFNLTVILGNGLVITAVYTSQKLRSVTNMFIVSLAVADLMLGIMVLPYSSANEVLRYWPFGEVWCSAWLAIDVWVSTASILNLCAISLDRYLAITQPFRYPRLMSPTRGKLLVTSVWIVSFIICFPPLIGWNEQNNGDIGSGDRHRQLLEYRNMSTFVWMEDNTFPADNSTYKNGINETLQVTECEEILPICHLVFTSGYIIYSALGSFWIPVWIMVFFYWRIYLTAARTSGALRRGVLTTRTSGLRASSSDSSVTLRVHRGGGGGRSPCNGDGSSMRLLSVKDACHRADRNSCSSLSERGSSTNGITPNHHPHHQRDIEYTQLQERSYNEFVPQQQRKPPKMLIKFKKSPPPTNLGLYNTSDRGVNSTLNVKALPGNSGSNRQPPSPSRSPDGRVVIEEQDIMRDEESAGGDSRSHRLLSRMGRMQVKGQIKRINKERKAAKTVGIIVGCFILCWLPFFSVYLLGAFCPTCTDPLVFTIFFWLGYCNSAINPCVYALFSKDFRYAFKKLLRCRCERKMRQRSHGNFQSILNSLRIQISSKASDSNSEWQDLSLTQAVPRWKWTPGQDMQYNTIQYNTTPLLWVPSTS